MLEDIKNRIILICIVLILAGAGVSQLIKLPEEILSKVAWTPIKPLIVKAEEDTGPAVHAEGSEVVELKGIETFCQHPHYPTGCESVSLYILLNYYGVDVTVADIVEALPKGEEPYKKDGVYYGADPHKVFVGDPRRESSFGVYNEPIAKTAQQFKDGAVAESGVSLERIKKTVAGRDPVIVWTTVSYERSPKVTAGWKVKETGEEIQWMGNEHAVVVYGYDADNIYVSDPYDGKKKVIPEEDFMRSYSGFGGMVVYYKK